MWWLDLRASSLSVRFFFGFLRRRRMKAMVPARIKRMAPATERPITTAELSFSFEESLSGSSHLLFFFFSLL
jgi:hypothetical protein